MHEDSRRLPRRVVDAGVVAGVVAVGSFGLVAPVVVGGADPARASAAALGLVVLQAGVLWWRREHSLAVLAATLGAVLLAQAVGDENASSLFGPHVAAYSLGVSASRRQAVAGVLATGAAAALDAALVRWGPAAASGVVLLTPYGMALAIAWGAGRYVAVRRAYVETLIAYGHQLEQERDEQARQAVRDERRRIARELHDQVAHHLGVVSLQTGAARRWLARDVERSTAALQAAEQAARSALETMPTILHALRADDAPAAMAPQPTLSGLPELVSRVATDDVSVDLRLLGEPRPLPAAVELAAYRLVQEALTNVAKHAGPAHVVVEVRFAPDRLQVEVADDGRGPAEPAAEGAGLGLVGMRERVELLDGSLTVGPGDRGGFRVTATLPLARSAV